ncbi:MAG: Rid family detoxifying hydrolase [Terriglobia bacterium]
MRFKMMVVSLALGLILPKMGWHSMSFSAEKPEVVYLNSPANQALGLPFSEAVRVGNMLYLAGQVGNTPGKLELVPGGIRAEAKQVMENMKAILERNGSSLDHVVKCTVFLADMKEWPTFNEIYRSYFSSHFPARSSLGTTGLALGARVEIECIAIVPAKKK